jgi:hypothetical protein
MLCGIQLPSIHLHLSAVVLTCSIECYSSVAGGAYGVMQHGSSNGDGSGGGSGGSGGNNL